MAKCYCDVCRMETDVVEIERKETYPVKGEPITVDARVKVCTQCGTDLFDEDLDNANLNAAFNIFRKKHGLLGSDDVRRIRKKYQLSQRGLAGLLGWSPATVARYETGALPSVSHNEQLKRLCNDPDYARELYERNASSLSELDNKRIKEALKSQHTAEDKANRALARFIDMAHRKSKDGRFGGNRRFDLDRLANIVVFFAKKIADLQKTKLLKLLWYADFLSYKRRGIGITGAVYCHNHYGPTPEAHEAILEYLSRMSVIQTKSIPCGPYEAEIVEAIAEFDEAMFTEEEVNILESVFKTFRHKTASTMTTITHLEDAYMQTSHKEHISYEYAAGLRAIH